MAGIGIVAESLTGFRGDAWLPDLSVGIGLAVIGAFMRWVDRRSGVGDIVAVAGAVWFIPNFGGLDIGPLAWLATYSIVLHRAVLFHAIAAFPSGRLDRPLEQLVVVLAYGAALIDVSRTEAGAIAWAAVVLLAFVAIVWQRRGLARAASLRVLSTAVLLSLVVAGTAALFLLLGNFPAPPAVVLAYDAGLVAVAFALLFNVLDHRDRIGRMADAAVELTLGPAGYVREMLADAMRDPSVEVAFPIEDGESITWVDELGRPIGPLRATGSRTVVPVLVDGRPVAQLACESAAIEEPGLMPSIEIAARLAAKNAKLRASLRAEADAVDESRSRLLAAADEQRIALADQLARGAGVSLTHLRAVIDSIPDTTAPPIGSAVARSRDRLTSLEAGLQSLSAGLGPSTLRSEGLGAALAQLGTDARVRIEIHPTADRLPDRLASTTYFICAEAIANALKHASATTVSVAVRVDQGQLHVEIDDDGTGGADVAEGSGLRGLSDRVAAVGGSLSVRSPAGEGTRISAEVPMMSGGTLA